MEAIILQIFIFLQIFYYPSNIFFARCIWGNITGYSPVLDQSRASETLCRTVNHNIIPFRSLPRSRPQREMQISSFPVFSRLFRTKRAGSVWITCSFRRQMLIWLYLASKFFFFGLWNGYQGNWFVSRAECLSSLSLWPFILIVFSSLSTVQMRLYTLTKRQFVLVFVGFFVSFFLTVIIGIAG